MKTMEEQARKIVEGIEFDLNDRSGFDLHCLDDDILQEIRDSWAKLIIDIMEEK